MSGRDYRVKLDFAYIPKNAYEDKLFFEIVLLCEEQKSAPELRDILLKKDVNGKDFWENRGRASSLATVEVIRDILDFAAYCGMVYKTYPFGSKRAGASYQWSNFGKTISTKFIKKDISVRSDLIKALMHYKIANNQLDFETYIEFKYFRVRPFFVLLKVLYLFQEKYPNLPLNVDPYDLGYVVLSIKTEDDSSIEEALIKLYDLVTERRTLEEFLKLQGSNREEFSKKTNNCITRLFRWSYCCGLIECSVGESSSQEFFQRWDGLRIKRVLGLSDLGRDVFIQLRNTHYYWEKNLHPAEIIILEVLKTIGEPLDKNELFEVLEKKDVVTRVRFERQIARLKSIFDVQEKSRELYLTKVPIFDGLNINLLRKVSDIVTVLEPTLKKIITEEIIPFEITIDENKDTYDFVRFNKILSQDAMEEYANMGVDRYFFDYVPLSVGDERLKKRYSDIRFNFEVKTASLLKQMNFDVTSFGQKSRGTSSVDIIAGWSRVSPNTNQRRDNITVIECKSSMKPYNLSLKDVDDRVRQISNLVESKNYKPVRTLINSLLFVSSSWGSGGNEEKIEHIEEKMLKDLNLQLKIGLIGSKQLLYLNSKYKNNPQKFEEFDFKDLFRNREITHVDIEKVFK